MERSAGILLSVSSLPSRYGIGCFDQSAYEFVDFLKSAKQSYWQILPLGPTGFGDSPYQSFSVFAGNPYFISLTELIDEGLLTKRECDLGDFGNDACSVDYQKLYENRYKLLEKAYRNSGIQNNPEFAVFCQNNVWIDDFALFMALKDKFNGASHNNWDTDIRLRKASVLEKYSIELAEKTHFYKFLQFEFFRQWTKLKQYANKNGVRIIGDIPIYAAYDSADLWSNLQLFDLDSNNYPRYVAGCPPDGFAKDGQLWGNPLYDWQRHKETGYKWWIKRLEHCFKLYDVVRIDHFRGFDEYYAIPNGDKNAKCGKWKKGPGIGLFDAVEKALGKKDIIAEDLGFVTDSVIQLVKDSGFANMKVLQFAFDSRDTGRSADYLPHNYKENCVAYTGTHDNHTLAAWFEEISDEERKKVREYICDDYTPDAEIHRALIASVMQSAATRCIIPMQDWLGLGDNARMNTPSTVGRNWKWRLVKNDISPKNCEIIRRMTEVYGRQNQYQGECSV
ncbi:MAG: 4-alpha-glucanotransferase [Oscillospiraceae bacterium]|nr:4-alpha-glucanotransferase [Oscillospiraceae bacterium]